MHRYFVLSLLIPFLPSSFLMCSVILLTLIWMEGTPFETITGHTAFMNGLLAEFSGDFLSSKVNARRSRHNPWYHFIIILSAADSYDWSDTWGKRPLAKNPDRSWLLCHTSFNLFLFFGQLSCHVVNILTLLSNEHLIICKVEYLNNCFIWGVLPFFDTSFKNNIKTVLEERRFQCRRVSGLFKITITIPH